MDNSDAKFLLQFFNYTHLPSHLQTPSRLFADAAHAIYAMSPEAAAAERQFIAGSQAASVFSQLCRTVDASTPANIEATEAVIKIDEARRMFAADEPLARVIRRLLEAKDCAVRAFVARIES